MLSETQPLDMLTMRAFHLRLETGHHHRDSMEFTNPSAFVQVPPSLYLPRAFAQDHIGRRLSLREKRFWQAYRVLRTPAEVLLTKAQHIAEETERSPSSEEDLVQNDELGVLRHEDLLHGGEPELFVWTNHDWTGRGFAFQPTCLPP